MKQPIEKTNDFAPAIVLMLAAPLLTEVLPGATRFSSIFVFSVEICVWGGGALLIRYAIRRWQLGWLNMLFLGLALAFVEECIIQQTSLAPLVIHLKGVEYARAFGINYVYLLWALIYETSFVVFAPIYLVALIFPSHKERTWISKTGFFIVIPLFIIGSLFAWFTWTHIAREKVFHVPVFNLSPLAALISLIIIFGLIFLSLRQFKKRPLQPLAAWNPPALWVLFIAGGIWATLLYGLVVLGFGAAPDFPPALAFAGGIVLIIVPLLFLPRWINAVQWQSKQQYALIFGTMLGAMLVGFIGFMDTKGPDLYFKIITNIIAIVLMILLGFKMNKQPV